jgi:uncharacterized membrane protein YkvA (DUF1232 family)
MDTGGVVALVGAVIVLWALMVVLFWVFRPKGLPTSELIRLVPDLIRLLRSLIVHRSAPLDVRIVLLGLLAWIISPIDLIPEFIPVLGPLDDVVVAVVAMRYVRRRMGIDDLRGRWLGSPDGFALLTRVIGRG